MNNQTWLKRMKDHVYGILPYLLLFGIPLVLAVIAFFGQISLNTSKANQSGAKEYRTYDAGYEEGLSVGREHGYDEGFNDGYSDGYDEGRSEGYDSGYSNGEADGYYAGATYACLFYGDVDRAFQSAKNGAAWYTFVDAYDEHIANIYDDEDTRIDVIWALISVITSDNATERDIELLISTFGEEMFIDNGIELKISN